MIERVAAVKKTVGYICHVEQTSKIDTQYFTLRDYDGFCLPGRRMQREICKVTVRAELRRKLRSVICIRIRIIVIITILARKVRDCRIEIALRGGNDGNRRTASTTAAGIPYGYNNRVFHFPVFRRYDKFYH